MTEGRNPNNGERNPDPAEETAKIIASIGNFFLAIDGFIKENATALIFFVTVAYTVFAAGQWWATTETLNEMRLGNRPWVGLPNGVQVIGTPAFEENQSFPNTSWPTITVEFTLRNVGASPAFRAAASTNSVAGDVRTIPEGYMDHACLFARQFGEVGMGNTLLPGGEITFTEGINISYPVKVVDIRTIWIGVCVAYQDSAQSIHYSKLWINSYVPEAETPTVVRQDGPSTFYRIPLAKWSIRTSDAN